MKFSFAACAFATTVAVFGGSTATTAAMMECPGDGGGSDSLNNGNAYMTSTDDSVEFGSCLEGAGSFTLNEGITVDVTDDSIMIAVTAKDGSESSLALYEDSVIVEWGVKGWPELTIHDPVYNYTNDIGSYLGMESDDDDADDDAVASSESSDESGEDGSPSSDDDADEEGFLVIIGSTDDCEVYMLAFNADAMINASPMDDCGFVTMATDDFVAIGNNEDYISFMEDSVMFGSYTGSNFTIEGVTTELNDAGDTVLTNDWGTMTFTVEGTVVFASNDPTKPGTLTMLEPVYNYTEDPGAFFITGDTEECAGYFVAFNEDGSSFGSEECGFLVMMTEDWTSVGTDDAFIVFMEDSMMFGSSVTFSNFTIDGLTTAENDDGEVVVTFDEGTMTFAPDGSLVFASNDPDADVLTMMNPVYNYTEEGADMRGGGAEAFTITGDTEECADFVYAFNADGLAVGSEDCNFLAVVDTDTMTGFLLTDDFVSFGNEDGFVAFSEDSVVFGSYSTGSNFTIDVDVTETDDEGIMMSYDEGSTTFTADDTVVLASSDPDADTLTINNPVYNYTDDALIISGDIEGCDDFVLAFNNDGVVSWSEDCGFITGGNEDGWIYASDDKIVVGNDEGSSEVLLDFGVDDGSCRTIQELLCDSPAADSYTTVCEWWTNSACVKASEGVSMTVFIPIDDAFDTLREMLDQADVVLDDKANEKILMFHATPGMVLSTDLSCTGKLEMFDSGSSRTKCGRAEQVDYLIQKGSGNRKNDNEPIIIAADIMACDESVIHIVSQVMLPNFIDDLDSLN